MMTGTAARRHPDAVVRPGIGRTPVVGLRVRTCSRTIVVRAKLESANPTGSSKDRTAAALVQAMHRERPLTPGTVVVESTSGNLGLALGRILHQMGCRLIVVVDPNTPADTRMSLIRSGVTVHVETRADETGGYLLNRLRAVRELCDHNPGYRWSNQYDSPANPWIHERTTGPELAEQGGPELDAVFVAVSTGGTLAGISRHLRRSRPNVRIVAVDAEGSRATGGCAGPRLLAGIGSGRPSSFLVPAAYDDVVYTQDALSIATCRLLRADTGLAVGGSSGSVLSACVRMVLERTGPTHPACLFPDGGTNYLSSLYNDWWLAGKGILPAVQKAERALRGDGLAFSLEGTYAQLG